METPTIATTAAPAAAAAATNTSPYTHLQPPLQFYELAIADKNWDRVDVVTAFNGQEEINPVVPVLRERALRGAYGKEVHFHLVSTEFSAGVISE